jgi:lysophospholipase L1-like esterase
MIRESTEIREDTDPRCLSDEAAAELLRDAPWRRMAVLGDSVAEGVGDPAPGYRRLSWAERVRRAMGARLAYLNLGRRDLLAADVARTQLGPALGWAPDLAMLVCGGNDMFRDDFDANAVGAQLARMVGALTAAGATVVTFGLLDPTRAGLPRHAARVRPRLHALNAATRQVADRYGALHVALTGHPAETDPDIWSADAVHGNARGHALVAAETIRALSVPVRVGGRAGGRGV